MAWLAPTEWERWDPDQLLICPYNAAHRITAKRFQYHILKCRKNYPERDFVTCPFNAKHIVLRPELRHHITRCADKTVLDGDPSRVCDNVKDSEGFYFKGNTSLPISTWEAPDDDEENWDDEDAQQTADTLNQCRMTETEFHQLSPEMATKYDAQNVLENGKSSSYHNGHIPALSQTESVHGSCVYQRDNPEHRRTESHLKQVAPKESLVPGGKSITNSNETDLSQIVQPSSSKTVLSLSIRQAYGASKVNMSSQIRGYNEGEPLEKDSHSSPQIIFNRPNFTENSQNYNKLTLERLSVATAQPKTMKKFPGNSNPGLSNTNLSKLVEEKSKVCTKEQEKENFKASRDFSSTTKGEIDAFNDKRSNVLVNSPPREQLKFAGAGRAKLTEEAWRSNFGRICSGQGRGRGLRSKAGFV